MNKFTLLTLTFFGTCTLHAELFTEHFKDGVVKTQIEYKEHTRTDTKEGVKHGLEKTYYNTGDIAFTVHNIDGKRDGTMDWYDREGNHLERINYKMGKRVGNNKIFYDDGTL